jgi:hypothetical protein
MVAGIAGTGGIVIEEGQGFSNSDSLASIEYADVFLANATWTAATVAVKGAALRKATMEWLEAQYQGRLRGGLRNFDQFLSMPRIGLHDDEGRTFPSDSIPERFRQAVSMVAMDIVVNSTTVLPTGVLRGAGVVEETRKLGTLVKTTKWNERSTKEESSLVVYQAADALIYPFVDSTQNNSVTVF